MVSQAWLARSVGGFAASAGVALFAASRGALDASGVVAAVAVGTATVASGGVGPGTSMIAFFASSSALSRLGRGSKAAVADLWEKGDRRDAGQVLANGGTAALCLAVSRIVWRRTLRVAAASALAVAAADTWATELGSLSGAPARLITTGAAVPRGTSGAITLAGCLAALAGSLFTAVWFPLGESDWSWGARRLGPVALAGVIGSLVDSWLGATVQAQYWCPSCRRRTERRIHACGSATTRTSGASWVGNDVVNLAATAIGGLIGVVLDRAWRCQDGSAR